MCGILGIASVPGSSVPLSDGQIARLRDLMSHRGPDGAGLWRRGNIVLAHRRLAVVDPSPAASQPMTTPDHRYAITYNGELYNDAALRAELASSGVRFHTRSDTETALHALAAWGLGALTRMRGMFSLAWVDVVEQRMILARDPLGIKPLFYWLEGGASEGEARQIVFASELPPILAHPDVPTRPSLRGVSAYLTTIRTTLGSGTLFEGVSTVRPGEALVVDLAGRPGAVGSSDGFIVARRVPYWNLSANHGGGSDADRSDAQTEHLVRETVSESVALHLRSDVPACVLLSGGLDSSIIASCAVAARSTDAPTLRSYCSGASEQRELGDFFYARLAASHIGTRHAESPVSRHLFRDRWPEMIHAMGVPLSTPNEVAINHVARSLRADGQVVALSGEGADELFAGYEQPMRQALAFESARLAGARLHEGVETDVPGAGGLHQLHANAWVPLHLKGPLLSEPAWRSLDADSALTDFYRDAFVDCGTAARLARADAPDMPDAMESLQPHLRLLRQINLAGLLARLDTATMLASVEGRTPFADRVVTELAERLPMRDKFGVEDCCGAEPAGSVDSHATATLSRVAYASKRVLRGAFEAVLPPEIIARPKASFPLPFEQWIGDHQAAVRQSSLARELFSPAALELVAGDAGANWRLAWPMLNIAIWAQRWWG